MELPLGEICAECRREIERRARRVGRWAAGIATAGMAVYVLVRMPEDETARVVGVVGVAAWYILTYLVAVRVAREYVR